MKNTHLIFETHNPETGRVESRSRITERGKKAVGAIALASIIGSGYGLNQIGSYLEHKKHISNEMNDFAKFNLANQPKELKKIMKKDHISEDELVRYKVQNELNAEEVAKDMGAYHWADVGDNVISSQVNDPNAKAHWSMHGGETVVIPKDLLSK